MSSKNPLENTRWEWAWLVECDTCLWSNFSQDKNYTIRAGEVHTDILMRGLGHEVTEVREIYG